MNKSLKKILVTGASLLMMASIGCGLSAHASRYPVNVADGTGFGRYIPWHHLHYITVNYINHGAGSAGSPERPSWFKKNGHVFYMDDQGDMTNMDGIHNPSKAQLLRALRGHSYHKFHVKYYYKHLRRNRHYHRVNRKHAKHNHKINRHGHHYSKVARKVRVRRKIAHKKGNHVKVNNRHLHNSRSQINRNCSELNHQTLSDINRDRRHYHLSGLRVNQRLAQVGSQRSYQLQHYFSHSTLNHSDEIHYLLNKKHINYVYSGENIASSPLGTIDITAVPHNGSQTRSMYHAHNGYQLANDIDDVSMNHDKNDSNDHRANILDNKFKQIGVGSSYDSHDRNYYLAVEFIG